MGNEDSLAHLTRHCCTTQTQMGSSATTKPDFLKSFFCVFVAFGFFAGILGFPAPPDDDRFLDRQFASPGGHQLASWLISQIRKNDYAASNGQLAEIPSAKRNSELTSSIMGIPRTMINNGR